MHNIVTARLDTVVLAQCGSYYKDTGSHKKKSQQTIVFSKIVHKKIENPNPAKHEEGEKSHLTS